MDDLIIVRGAGDLATGVIYRLRRCGFKVLALETANPSAIRRTVSFCEAVFDKTAQVEGEICERADSFEEVLRIIDDGHTALMVDPEGKAIEHFRPRILIDAIIAKKNLGTHRAMADFVIALGPGFTAGEDVDCVLETMRGHNLGRLIYKGRAAENTGIPGIIGGFGRERVIHAPADGVIRNIKDIGSIVEKEEIIALIGDTEVRASISGILRGIIRSGYCVKRGLKIADIDPRANQADNCHTISDKSRSIGGGVLEAVLRYMNTGRKAD